MTSHCGNCGEDKGSNFHANYCDTCTSLAAGAEAAAQAEGRNIYVARRAALAERAHSARKNFVDPRSLNKRTIWLYGNAPPEALPGAGGSDGK
jgi:hypothetical protein